MQVASLLMCISHCVTVVGPPKLYGLCVLEQLLLHVSMLPTIESMCVPKPTAVMDMRQSTAFVRMCESLCRHGGDMACKCTHVQSTFKH